MKYVRMKNGIMEVRKGLEALEDLIIFISSGEIADTHELCEYVAKRKDIIETELKRLEQLEIDFNELDSINDELNLSNHELRDENVKLYNILRILKEKLVDVGALVELDLELYNNYVKEINGTPTLTPEEYKLLKEWFK